MSNVKSEHCDKIVDYGGFFWSMPVMGGLLLICYVWGRYYANKLDYARTVQILLEDSDSEGEAGLDGTSQMEHREYERNRLFQDSKVHLLSSDSSTNE